MSLRMRAAALLVAWRRGPVRTPPEMRRDYFGRNYPPPAPIRVGLRKRAGVGEERIAGCPVYTLTPRRGRSPWHIIYTHGGSFVDAITRYHWDAIEELIRATGATVTVPLYPLAPEHEHPRAHAFLEQVYRGVIARTPADRVVLCGDSAGGNLALVQALRYRDLGLPPPAHVILFAPWVDVTMSHPDIPAIHDPMLWTAELVETGRWWAGSVDPRDPRVSPLHADLRGLPPIQLYQGTDDLFLPDARVLRDRVQAAGGRIDLHETAGAFHVFMAATFLPEARAVYRQIAAHMSAHQ